MNKFAIPAIFCIFAPFIMARIIALDIGGKRTGVAVTDPMQMIASGLTTVATDALIDFLKKYLAQEAVEAIVVGDSKNLDASDNDATPIIRKVTAEIQKNFPNLPLRMVDERFTSVLASRSMKMAGASRKQMKSKETVDMVSATIILQTYLDSKL